VTEGSSPVSLLGLVLLPFTRFTVGHTPGPWPPDPSLLHKVDNSVTYETATLGNLRMSETWDRQEGEVAQE